MRTGESDETSGDHLDSDEDRTRSADGGGSTIADGGGATASSVNGSFAERRSTTEADTSILEGETTVASDADTDILVTADDEATPVVSVVMPTMNEEEGISECIDRIIEGASALGLPTEIVVSDSSSDRTPEIARERGARVITPDKPGYGYAYRYAFARVRGDYVVMGDADTTYDFSELPRLFKPILDGEADMVMGSRLEGEILPGAMPPLHQYVGNPLLTKFLNVFYGAGVSDAHSGFRVFRADLLDELDLRTDGMEFASEMVMDASARGFEIAEVPITYHERKGEATLESFRDGWRHVRFMLMNAPGYLFSIPGVLMVLLGGFMMGLSAFGVQPGGVNFGIHTMIAGSLLVVVGYQTAVLSLFSTVAADPIRVPTDPLTRWIQGNFRLEQGATIGLGMFAVGAAYGSYLLYGWITSGYGAVPFGAVNMVAFTLVVVGLETVFASFHLSALADARNYSDAGLAVDEEAG
ncbi:glycosyltransferase family 2 protein [Salinirubellus sp. GCM10025818]|jgi:glycosyltransferase involved in cell wall biosynthesis|uniref:glycosyltransferase family 2 protein n=1 Tax=Salinirubellus TaxID=2162630 RepID=UPI0030D06876